jgi:hypothetical protein
MLFPSLHPKTRRTFFLAVGFLCCALIALTGIVQVAHTHLDGQVNSADCALCHTAHLVVQPSIPQVLPHIVRVVATVASKSQPVHAKQFSAFSLFTRPPPVAIAFA